MIRRLTTWTIFSGLLFLVAYGQSSPPGIPDGGMWLPHLLKDQNASEMQAMGLAIPLDSIYNETAPSLKDAVVSFGGFCSGALISADGLLLTNHHCGYNAIEKQARRGRNPLRDGYWAEERDEELPNPGLTATVLVRIEDVTAEMLAEMHPDLPEGARKDAVARKKAWLEHSAAEGTRYEAEVKPAYEGNKWFLFVTETFRDVRLVGTPPVSVARFGGDAAGRVWPMHIADFALFRVYADSSNRPADYSRNNIPYRPRKWHRISLRGVRENDFAMVYGFPGNTEQYLSSYGLHERMNIYTPPMLRLREKTMTVLQENLKSSKRHRAKYEPVYASMHNEELSLRNERAGLVRTHALEEKRAYEAELVGWISGDSGREARYGKLLWGLREAYEGREKILETGLYVESLLSWVGLMELANGWRALEAADRQELSRRKWNRAKDAVRKQTGRHFKGYHAATDEQLFAALLGEFVRHLPQGKRPEFLQNAEKRYKGDYQRIARDIYKKSALTGREPALELLKKLQPGHLKKLRKDAAYKFMNALLTFYNDHYLRKWKRIERKLEGLSRDYVAAMLEMLPDTRLYPDADASLRLSYGRISGYAPEDGVIYRHYTTRHGLQIKSESGDPAYALPKKLQSTFFSTPADQYESQGDLWINFLSSNHTARGSSGSPVLNAKGELVGLNCARTLEGAMSDLIYDGDQVRNVAVDIRYILFFVDKMMNVTAIMEEVDIIP